MVAAQSGFPECAELLLEAHDPAEQVMAANSIGGSALMMAAGQGQAGCVKLLLSASGGSLAAAQCEAKRR